MSKFTEKYPNVFLTQGLIDLVQYGLIPPERNLRVVSQFNDQQLTLEDDIPEIASVNPGLPEEDIDLGLDGQVEQEAEPVIQTPVQPGDWKAKLEEWFKPLAA